MTVNWSVVMQAQIAHRDIRVPAYRSVKPIVAVNADMRMTFGPRMCRVRPAHSLKLRNNFGLGKWRCFGCLLAHLHRQSETLRASNTRLWRWLANSQPASISSLKIAERVQLRERMPLHVRPSAQRMVCVGPNQDRPAHRDGVRLPARVAAHPVLRIDQHTHPLCAVAKVGNVGDRGVTHAVGVKEYVAGSVSYHRPHCFAWRNGLRNSRSICIVLLSKAHTGERHHRRKRHRGCAAKPILHPVKSPIDYCPATERHKAARCQQFRAGVVKNFSALAGTGGGSTAQDFSEIEFSQ